LGIVIGVAAVIAMLTIGNGTTAKVTADLSKLGSNMLIARPGQNLFGPGGTSAESRSFTERDVLALRAELRDVKAVAPSAQKQMTVVAGSQNYDSPITGTDAQFFIAQDWTFAEGRPFSDGEVRAGSALCVIGQTVKQQLFGQRDPVGGRIRLGSISCEVIGVLAAKGQSAFGTDQDNTVVMPLRAYQRRIAGNTRIGTIYIAVANRASIPEVLAGAQGILRQQRRLADDADDDFTVRDMTQIVSTMIATSTMLTGLLGAIAAVSLLVGGIGIMNIMLVSVTERTREIGIRLAIGALERQVLMQFLVEATVLALLGGVLGVALGLGIALAASYGMDIPFTADPAIAVMAFAFSALIGLAFGFFPARRAARLDPIDALRHE
jgi:putative ABC transport system permease protein